MQQNIIIFIWKCETKTLVAWHDMDCNMYRTTHLFAKTYWNIYMEIRYFLTIDHFKQVVYFPS